LLPIVIIDYKELETLINFAKNSLPKECCALLIGNENRDKVIIYNIVTLRNYDESIFSFSIDPQDLFFGYQQADHLGLEVVGIFHSHPSLPFPSSKDKKFMQLNPFIWLIYSTMTEEYRGFIYRRQVKEVKLHVVMG
jgi:proteasome lid subunit RPN8/RPN11